MQEWDVFISHATEDKAGVARPLAQQLGELGLRVWIDESELRVGDSLRESIDRGLARSRFGVVILSRAFFAKKWPQRELNGLLAREASGDKVVLPVWHGVDAGHVARHSPILADRVSLSTELGIERVAAELADVCSSGLVATSATPGRARAPEEVPGAETVEEAVSKKDLAIAYRQAGNFIEAEELFDDALRIHRQVGSLPGEANVLNNVGILYRMEGRYVASEVAHAEAIEIYRQIGNRRGEADCMRQKAMLHRQRRAEGDIELARNLLEGSLAIFRACGDRVGEGKTLNELGILCRETGSIDEARRFLQEAIDAHRQTQQS